MLPLNTSSKYSSMKKNKNIPIQFDSRPEVTKLSNPKKAYKTTEWIDKTGTDFEPKSIYERRYGDKDSPTKEHDAEKNLSATNLGHYMPDNKTLGSPSDYDNFDDESRLD